VTERVLIVNADDFGRAPGITRGVARAFDEGLVTSTSLMTRWPAAGLAVQLAAARPRLGVGLHLDLGEWVYREGAWAPTYDVVDLDSATAVEREVGAQLEAFRALVGGDPTHVDSHQHVHRSHAASARAAAALADGLGVPLRGAARAVRHCGEFYGRTARGEPYPDGIGVANLRRLVSDLPSGITELGCHPGDDPGEDPLYGPERVSELHVLCDPAVRAAVERAGVRLASFADLGR
jgi:chitin disaccharide deacetylase